MQSMGNLCGIGQNIKALTLYSLMTLPLVRVIPFLQLELQYMNRILGDRYTGTN